MKTLLILFLVACLVVCCWPLGIAAFFLLFFFWLILLPFKILGVTLQVLFTIAGAIILFPFKLLAAIF